MSFLEGLISVCITGTTAIGGGSAMQEIKVPMNNPSTSSSPAIIRNVNIPKYDFSQEDKKAIIYFIMKHQHYEALRTCFYGEDIIISEQPVYFPFFNFLRTNTQDTNVTNTSYPVLLKQVYYLNDEIMQKAILNMLSTIDYSNVLPEEEQFVVDCFKDGKLSVKEFALNTISCWNNKEIIGYVKDVTVDHVFLQKRLNKIVNRYYGA